MKFNRTFKLNCFVIIRAFIKKGELYNRLASRYHKPRSGRARVQKISGSGLTARLVLDDETKADAYGLRHRSYLSGGHIDPQPGGLFSDADDLRPNNRSIMIYKHRRPAASVHADAERLGGPFTDGLVHVNGIESFWSYTKRHLARFNGIKANFELHIKECEWRWGKDPDTILAELKKLTVESLLKKAA
jgi:hypothetical protein